MFVVATEATRWPNASTRLTTVLGRAVLRHVDGRLSRSDRLPRRTGRAADAAPVLRVTNLRRSALLVRTSPPRLRPAARRRFLAIARGVEVLRDAYVSARTGESPPSARCAGLIRTSRVRRGRLELAVASLAYRGLSPATLTPVSPRPLDDFELRGEPAPYEVLQAGRRRNSRDRSGDPVLRRSGPGDRFAGIAGVCGVRVRRRSKPSPFVNASIARRSSPRYRDPESAGIADLARAHAVPPEFRTPMPISLRAHRIPAEAYALAAASDVFLRRLPSDFDQARRRDQHMSVPLGLALLSTAISSRARCDPAGTELGARSVGSLVATVESGNPNLAASVSSGVLLPASALFLDRPMPPARALVDGGGGDRKADRLQPRQFLLRTSRSFRRWGQLSFISPPAGALGLTVATPLFVVGRPRCRRSQPLRGGPRPARRSRTGRYSLPPREATSLRPYRGRPVAWSTPTAI